MARVADRSFYDTLFFFFYQSGKTVLFIDWSEDPTQITCVHPTAMLVDYLLACSITILVTVPAFIDGHWTILWLLLQFYWVFFVKRFHFNCPEFFKFIHEVIDRSKIVSMEVMVDQGYPGRCHFFLSHFLSKKLDCAFLLGQGACQGTRHPFLYDQFPCLSLCILARADHYREAGARQWQLNWWRWPIVKLKLWRRKVWSTQVPQL